MADSLGKSFEEKFKEDWCKLADADIIRLYDQVTGYKTVSRNPSDYVCYKFPYQFYLECKTTKENTFSISKLTQYDKMKEHAGIKGVVCGAVIWFYKHDKVVFVPLETFTKLETEGKKSVNINMLGQGEYILVDIPSVKKRVYLDSDYNAIYEFAKVSLKSG